MRKQYLISGDAAGTFKVWDTLNNFAVLLEGKAKQPAQHVPSITSLEFIDKDPSNPLVIAGDTNGNISVARITNGMNLNNSFCGHFENPRGCARVFKLPNTQQLVSIGKNGATRLWMN